MDLNILLQEILNECSILKDALDNKKIKLNLLQNFYSFFREKQPNSQSLNLNVSEYDFELEHEKNIWFYIDTWKWTFTVESYNDENIAEIHMLLDNIYYTSNLKEFKSNIHLDDIIFEILFQINEVVVPNNLEPLLWNFEETILK